MEPNQSPQPLLNSKPTALGLKILFKALSSTWLLWCGMWILLIAIAFAAAFSITNTGFEKHLESNTTQITVKKSEPSNNTWLLSALPLTFVFGSIVLGKQLNRCLKSRRVRATVQVTNRQERKRRLKERMTLLESLPSEIVKPVEVILPGSNFTARAESESLAEMMDIRKYRSLDSILRD